MPTKATDGAVYFDILKKHFTIAIKTKVDPISI